MTSVGIAYIALSGKREVFTKQSSGIIQGRAEKHSLELRGSKLITVTAPVSRADVYSHFSSTWI